MVEETPHWERKLRYEIWTPLWISLPFLCVHSFIQSLIHSFAHSSIHSLTAGVYYSYCSPHFPEGEMGCRVASQVPLTRRSVPFEAVCIQPGQQRPGGALDEIIWHQTFSLLPSLSLRRAWRRWMGPPGPGLPWASPASSSWFSWAVVLWASPAWLSSM